MPNRIYTFMGLAVKAGKLVSGEANCEKVLRTMKAHLVVVAQDASQGTKKNFIDACRYRRTEFRIYGEKEVIGRYIGKEMRSVIAITDESFAKRLMEMIDTNKKEDGGARIVESQNI